MYAQLHDAKVKSFYAIGANKPTIYSSLATEYTLPYTLQKELILKNDIDIYDQKKLIKEKQLLQTIYVGLLGIKGDFEISNKMVDELLMDNNLDETLKTKALIVIANNATKKLNYSFANEKYTLAKDLAIKINDKEDEVLATIGMLYKYIVLRQTDIALKEIDKIKTDFSIESRDKLMALIYRFKSTCYFLKLLGNEKKYKKDFFEYTQKSQALAEKINDIRISFSNFFGLSIYYSNESKQTDSANYYLLKAIDVGKQAGTIREIYMCYNYLVQNYTKQNDLDNAEKYAKEALDLSKNLDTEEMQLEKYYSLAGIYVKKKEDKKIMEMIDSIRSSVVTTYTKRFDLKFAELQTQSETSEKEKKIQLLKKERLLNEFVIQQQKSDLLKNFLEQSKKKIEIELLNKDKILLSQNNEILLSQNNLKTASLLNREMQLKQKNIEKEKQQIEIEKLKSTQKILQLKNLFFYLVLGIVLIFSILFLFWNKHKQKIKSDKEKQSYQLEILESKLTAFRAQMNPHFLFNSINAVNHYILNNDKHQASIYLSKYSKLMRQVLENSNKQLVTLKEEIDTIKNYIELEQLRYNHNFSFEIKNERNLNEEDIMLPPLILQPFIENSITHGFFHKKEKGKIDIFYSIEKNMLKIVIDDNGIGREKSKSVKNNHVDSHKSMGLDITSSRLDFANKIENNHVKSVTYIDKKDSENNALGTQVILLLPFINA